MECKEDCESTCFGNYAGQVVSYRLLKVFVFRAEEFTDNVLVLEDLGEEVVNHHQSGIGVQGIVVAPQIQKYLMLDHDAGKALIRISLSFSSGRHVNRPCY